MNKQKPALVIDIAGKAHFFLAKFLYVDDVA
jgi:hypothetical protein